MPTQVGLTQAPGNRRASRADAPRSGHFVEGAGHAKGLCVLGNLLKAPGYGVGVTLATGRGGDFTYNPDNFPESHFVTYPTTELQYFKLPRKGRHGGFVFLRLK